MKSIIKNLIKITNQQMLVPFYHMASNDENSFAKYLYPSRKVETFKKDLEVLLEYYKPVSLQEFIELSALKQPLKKNYFHLTFDDGLANFYTIVAPILEEKKIPATVFVNSDFVDNKALFYRYKASLLIQLYENSTKEKKEQFYEFLKQETFIKEKLLSINYKTKFLLDDLALKVGLNFNDFLKNNKPYLTTKHIKDLINRGFTIGAHSKDHPLFSEISLQEQINQTQENLSFLQNNFDINYSAFSFPFTDLGVDKAFFSKLNLEISFGTSGIKKDTIKSNFQRISFELADNDIELFLLKSYLKYFLKIPFRKHIMPRN